jgi:hypothetical protein
MSGGKIFSMHKDPVMLDVTIPIGASGAVGTIKGACIKSVTRLSAGKYKIAFDTSPSITNFARLIFASAAAESASGGLSGVLAIEIQNAPSTSVASATAPSLTIQCLDAAGAAVDPANGSSIKVLMILANTGITVNGD